ncbi:hypothetical protein M5689_009160 [Euphorbia peplus]|nr:hypothetical protein M5689_009160 [Euphorbia peplus]
MRLANSRDRRRRMCAFYCTYCRKAFSSRQARRNHLSVHQEEVTLRRSIYRSHCSSNPTGNSGNVLIPSMPPLFNLEASSSNFSQDNIPVNVDANSHLIVPPNLSFNGGSTEIFHSNCSYGTTSLNTPIAFSSGPSSFSGGNEVSFFTAAEKQTSQGGKPINPVTPVQNHQYPNLRNKKPYVDLTSEDRPKKELPLFKDVSTIVISSEDEDELHIDLDLALHL